MVWKCLHCNTVNRNKRCVKCGRIKPVTVYKKSGVKKLLTGVGTLTAVIILCAASALAGITLSNIRNRAVPADAGTENAAPDTETEQTAEKSGQTVQTEEELLPDENKNISVNIDSDKLNLTPGESAVLNAVINGGEAGAEVIWSSSDTGVAAVSADGTVTAAGVGMTQITASYGGAADTCIVTVAAVEVTGITLPVSDLVLVEGSNYTLSAAITPENATDKTLLWTTSDSDTVRCDGGVLTAVSPGSATITVRTTNGKSAVCYVNVTAAAAEIESVSLNASEITLRPGDSYTLTAEVTPPSSLTETEWVSSDSSVAGCENGIVTALSPGQATITVSINGMTAACEVAVVGTEPVSLTLSETELTLNTGDTYTLTAVTSPDDMPENLLFWESGNENIVSCDNGMLTAHEAGTTYITVRVSNGPEAVCTVNVVDVQPESVSLDITELTLKPGDLYTFTVTVYPAEAADTVLVWETDNPAAVNIVGSDGSILAAGEGSAVITVTAGNGICASCAVTVKSAASNPESDFSCSISGGGVIIADYTGRSAEVVIPEKIGGLAVTAVGNNAFYNKNIISVKIPGSVMRIVDFAFAYCTMLGTIEFKEGTEFIGDYAFTGCAVSGLSLPSTVAHIGEGAFAQCGNLAGLSVSEANPYFTVYGGAVYNTDMSRLICYPAGLYSVISEFPSTLTEIGPAAFFGCSNLKSAVIPRGVTSIGKLAFAYCGSMSAVELPETLRLIGSDAFAFCSSLESVVIPPGVTDINERAFSGCQSLASVTLSDNVSYIADNAFEGCPSLVIYCPKGSYAEQYAREKEIPVG
jgi:uncharacterized protein YjdB